MQQAKALSLSEALLFVERNVREACHGHLPIIQPAVVRVLQQDGSDVPMHGFAQKGMQIEVALFSILVMTLIYFDRCNALVVTTSEEAARLFFEKHLFVGDGPNGTQFAARCGKTLRLITISTTDFEKEAAAALNNYSIIPVMDLSTIRRAHSLATSSPTIATESKKHSWLTKLFSQQPLPPAQSLLQEGLSKLNCVIKLSGEMVSLDNEVGVMPILEWAAKQGFA